MTHRVIGSSSPQTNTCSRTLAHALTAEELHQLAQAIRKQCSNQQLAQNHRKHQSPWRHTVHAAGTCCRRDRPEYMLSSSDGVMHGPVNGYVYTQGCSCSTSMLLGTRTMQRNNVRVAVNQMPLRQIWEGEGELNAGEVSAPTSVNRLGVYQIPLEQTRERERRGN